MSKLHHPHITQFYGACLEPEACIVMECMTQGSLNDVIEKNTLDFPQKLRVALDIAKGLTYLHDRGVFHRDLNPGNVLLNDDYVAKLTDFGLSKDLNPQVVTVGSVYEQSRGGNTHLHWMAPELMGRGMAHSEASDIYAYGMVVWRLMTGKTPFADIAIEKLAAHIRSGGHESLPADLPQELSQLILRCWSLNANLRPEASAVVEELTALTARFPVKTLQRSAGSAITLAKPSFFSPEEHCNEGQRHEQEHHYDQAYACYLESAKRGFFRANLLTIS